MYALIAYVLALACANWELHAFGSYPVAPGLVAPAGAFSIGLSFLLRAAVQVRYGWRAAATAAMAASLLSGLLYPPSLLDSVPAFLLAQALADAIHAAFPRRPVIPTLALATLAGVAVDSLVYLWLSDRPLSLLLAQLVGKTEAAFLPLAALWLARRWRVTLLRLLERLLADALFLLQTLLWVVAWYSALRLAWPGDTLALHPLYRQLARMPDDWWALLFAAIGVATTAALWRDYRGRPARAYAWAIWQLHAALWVGIGLSLFAAAPLTWVGGLALAFGGIAQWVVWSPHLAVFVRAMRQEVGDGREP